MDINYELKQVKKNKLHNKHYRGAYIQIHSLTVIMKSTYII